MKSGHSRGLAIVVLAILFVPSFFLEAPAAPSFMVQARIFSAASLPLWVPMGNIANETQKGNGALVDAWFEDSATPPQYRKIKVELANISAWPGVCGNSGYNTQNDAKIEASLNPAWDVDATQTSATTKAPYPPGLRIRLTVSIFDYAARFIARTTVGFYANPSPWIKIPADTDNDNLPDYIEGTLPPAASDRMRVDSDGDGIRDDLEDDDSIQLGANDTQDPRFPEGSHTIFGVTGDGLTRWEEYRGFAINGVHARTKFHEKDLFVNTLNLLPVHLDVLKAQHIGKIRTIQNNEWTGNLGRVINENNKTVAGTSLQRGVYVRGVQFRVAQQYFGITENDVPPNGVPSVCITSGPDGRCGTSPSGDDGKYMDVGQTGPPDAPAIHTGPNGVCDTFANNSIWPGDDDQILGPNPVSLSPNETKQCILFMPEIALAATSAQEYDLFVQIVAAHEMGHATHVEHWYLGDPLHQSPPYPETIMQTPGLTPARTSYDAFEKAQMRIHTKHR